MMPKPRLGIFGCGWLGTPLAQRLASSYTVKAAVRTQGSAEKLRLLGFETYVTPEKGSAFWECDVLVIAIPPREGYIKRLEEIAANLSGECSRAVLLSSTSVYRGHEGLVDETIPLAASGLMAEGEVRFRALFPEGVILRLGGLMGDDRIAGQRRSAIMADGPVNYIHQEDAVRIISGVIEAKRTCTLYNLVAPVHPLRSRVYRRNGSLFGYTVPEFSGFDRREVSSEKVIRALGYRFIHPDPLRFWEKV
jgi:nucleoside-diphosphate-sugar epimerase